MSNGKSYIHMMTLLIRLVSFRFYHKSFILIQFPTFSTITGDTNTAMTGVQITRQPQHFTKCHSTITLTIKPTQRKQICMCYINTAKTKRSSMPSPHRSSSMSYISVSQPPGPGINYTGPREVLLEFVISVF